LIHINYFQKNAALQNDVGDGTPSRIGSMAASF